ncbi:AEC family transporter [Acinetobacter tianfuensis]|uniref:AEC family transporter n=1 Tax=Acinetobacter tianfuensis TaxID=2419603 RepID=A0A3A8EII5_9GAMM|nr:AEC family transporter [Acinetobacter tianfuensis]RKG30560.1 AEC family transporter [Acinetobacter tianfuensis]
MVFDVIFPILFLLALGYISVRSKGLNPEHIAALGNFVIKAALPVLIFISLAAKNVQDIWLPQYFIVYAGVAFLLYGAAFLICLKYFQQPFSHAAVLALGASMSNTGMLGTAILTMLMGQQALTYIAPVLIIESVLMVPLVLALVAMGQQQGVQSVKVLQQTLLILLKNPLFIAVVLGLLCAVWGIAVPKFMQQSLSLLGQTASPLALFVIGGGIVGMTMQHMNLQSIVLIIFSNICMPLLVYAGLRFGVHAEQEMLYAGTIIAALPMPAMFALLGQMYGLKDKTLTPLLISTLLGFVVVGMLIAFWFG